MASSSDTTLRAFVFGAWRPFDQRGTLLPRGLQLVQMLGVAFPVLVFILLASAPFDAGTYELNGRQVSGPEFLTQGGGAVFGSLALFLAVVGFGIWRGRTWTRTALITGLGVLFIGGWMYGSRGSAQQLEQLLSAVVVFLIPCWYLYFKRGTKAYYEGLQAQSLPGAASS